MNVSRTDRLSFGCLSWAGSGETPSRWRVVLFLSLLTLKQEVQQNTNTFWNYNLWKLFSRRFVEFQKGSGSPGGGKGQLSAQRSLCQPALRQPMSQPWPLFVLLRSPGAGANQNGLAGLLCGYKSCDHQRSFSLLLWCETCAISQPKRWRWPMTRSSLNEICSYLLRENEIWPELWSTLICVLYLSDSHPWLDVRITGRTFQKIPKATWFVPE